MVQQPEEHCGRPFGKFNFSVLRIHCAGSFSNLKYFRLKSFRCCIITCQDIVSRQMIVMISLISHTWSDRPKLITGSKCLTAPVSSMKHRVGSPQILNAKERNHECMVVGMSLLQIRPLSAFCGNAELHYVY